MGEPVERAGLSPGETLDGPGALSDGPSAETEAGLLPMPPSSESPDIPWLSSSEEVPSSSAALLVAALLPPCGSAFFWSRPVDDFLVAFCALPILLPFLPLPFPLPFASLSFLASAHELGPMKASILNGLPLRETPSSRILTL
eukprot:CAMPEP_0174722704 /NCGR_PEP_ID=MMETSP1094-20130205/39085_1 /TAXON_ID=156173 /ORGANISM="Chrysochromulina brevifilum, Strain UTEX LB 985" /LENGTH=142 /DNA_ID=CAMNT_0015923613 /DNA_START=146 /DNA_END=574 /DNA_ORIENTATION=+